MTPAITSVNQLASRTSGTFWGQARTSAGGTVRARLPSARASRRLFDDDGLTLLRQVLLSIQIDVVARPRSLRLQVVEAGGSWGGRRPPPDRDSARSGARQSHYPT